MGQSKRRDKPRCSKCKGEIGRPIPVSVRATKNQDYITLRCGCGYEYVSTSSAAFRMAIGYKLADYSHKHLGREIKFSIRFNVAGEFESMWAANAWLHEHGYAYGSTGRGSDPVAIQIGSYGLPQKWHNIYDTGRRIVDGVMYCDREGPAIIYLFNLTDKV